MANRQAIAIGPVYVNETGTRQAISIGPVYLNETVATTPPPVTAAAHQDITPMILQAHLVNYLG